MSCDARHRLCDFGFIQHLTTAVAGPLPVSEKMNPPGRSVPERWAFWTGTRRTGTIWFRKTVFRASPPGYHRPFHDFPPGCMQFAHDLITIDAESALSYPRSTGVAGFYSRRNAINTQQLEPAGSSSQIKMRASVSRATSRALSRRTYSAMHAKLSLPSEPRAGPDIKVLIVGAGNSGSLLARENANRQSTSARTRE